MSFTAAIHNLERVEVALLHQDAPSNLFKGDDLAETVEECVSDLVDALEELPLSRGVEAQAQKLEERVETIGVSNERGRTIIVTAIEDLQQAVIADLTGPLCLMVDDPQMRYLYEQPVEAFDRNVVSKFPDTQRDIEAGSRCLALDQWTASVFHMMRVVEHGLRAMAKRLNVQFATGIDQQNWQNIIEKLEKEIRNEQHNLPKGSPKSKRLQFLADVAGQFWHFKEAWRNHVAHARATYDEATAREVYSAVQSVMHKLADGP